MRAPSPSDVWYAEFVFLYYRMAMVACTVMLGSSERTNECLLGMACATSGLLLFVVRVKPFDDGSTEDPEHLTGADKMQAYSLVATLTALLIALICKQNPDRSEDFDLLVDVVLAVIGIVPVAVGLSLWICRTRPADVGKKDEKVKKVKERTEVEFGNPLLSPMTKTKTLKAGRAARRERDRSVFNEKRVFRLVHRLPSLQPP